MYSTSDIALSMLLSLPEQSSLWTAGERSTDALVSALLAEISGSG